MCLLIAGKSNAIRTTLLNTEGLLHDIFRRNEDGLGAMFITDKSELLTPKVLPKNLTECIAFIEQLPNDERSLALHWRMRTHGDTDLANCHPYTIIEGRSAMMHNGVLQSGNKADPSKSDTWHYINNTVRPILAEAPNLFMNSAWQQLVEDDIGTGNRFAIMDNFGNLAILNKRTGIEHDGIWFSNTYAWSPEILIEEYKSVRMGRTHGGASNWHGPLASRIRTYGGMGAWDPEDDDDIGYTGALAPQTMIEVEEDDIWEALGAYDPEGMGDLLDARPHFVLTTIFKECEFMPTTKEMSEGDEALVKMLVDQDTQQLFNWLFKCDEKARANKLGEIICWYGDWVGKAIEAKGEATPDPTNEQVIGRTVPAAPAPLREKAPLHPLHLRAIEEIAKELDEAEKRNETYAG